MTEPQPANDRLELELDLPPGQEPEEGELTRRSVKYTPEQQGLEIPAGWRPTVAKPIPVVRCVYVRPDTHAIAPGERCNKWSMRGSRLCYFHSGRGNLKNVEEYRHAVVDAARLELVDAAPDAVKTMLDLMMNSGADAVRLKAAESVLDRNGIKTATEIDVTVNDVTGSDPAQTLAERLGKLRVAAEHVRVAQEKARNEQEALALEAAPLSVIDTDAEVIEGEIVQDSADGTEESAE